MLKIQPDELMQKVGAARDLYHRLVLLVAPAGAGKTAILLQLAGKTGVPCVNVNQEASRRMLEMTEKQRALRTATVLAEIVDATGGDPVRASARSWSHGSKAGNRRPAQMSVI